MPETEPLPHLLTIEQLAEHLGVTQRHVRRLVAEKRVPYLKWRRFIRFDPAEINRLARQRPSARGRSAPWPARPSSVHEPLRLFEEVGDGTEATSNVETTAPLPLQQSLRAASEAARVVGGSASAAFCRCIERPCRGLELAPHRDRHGGPLPDLASQIFRAGRP